MDMQEIVKPASVVDEGICRGNIRRMLAKAQQNGCRLRPHFKTHQSLSVGRWFREAGVRKIAVSSLAMAQYFAADGWDDILVAFPVNLREIGLLNALASKIKLGVLLADAQVWPVLQEQLIYPVDIYLKIDVGTHRTGFNPDAVDEIRQLAIQLGSDERVQLKGLVAHAGHTYQAADAAQIAEITACGLRILEGIRTALSGEFSTLILSWGDTPGCSLLSEFQGFDELRPGNFVFYDLMQIQLGACSAADVGYVAALPVVARHPDRMEVVLYGGAVHLSKESLNIPGAGQVYGQVVLLEPGGWQFPETAIYLSRLSQEHGIFRCPETFWDYFKPGRLAGVVPVHSCLTADLLRDVYDTNGLKLA